MKKIKTETLADLKRSGLNLQAALKMKIRDVSAEDLLEVYCKACRSSNMVPPKNLQGVHGYEIPYLDFEGKHTGFSRYKIFGEYIPKGQKRAVKYLQLPATKPRFYFPPFCDWKQIAQDPTIEIYFVEGEKKASALALLGLAAIGLGGVWSWRTRADDDTSDPIPDFNLLNLKNRKTVIVFDADV